MLIPKCHLFSLKYESLINYALFLKLPGRVLVFFSFSTINIIDRECNLNQCIIRRIRLYNLMLI